MLIFHSHHYHCRPDSAHHFCETARHYFLLDAVFSDLSAITELFGQGLLAMDGGKLYGRGMAFPPRVGDDGSIAWSEGETNIREAIQIILKTQERERLNLPRFGAGLQRYLFEPNTVTTRFQIQDRITKALQQ